ncbi:winged helix-turn-helix domain-containing protein [Lysobacter sp. MMG2]|uniref:ATP-binding protein n=1 Tax=Lysobacter sp. MMG2 TaxID=2801338 RepID=UPI001C24914B|nr:winged helix-turn-helix domain-containing protein [Lysobacter sp. MMG2]MBU8977802.1 winged helix-turn-helix domain-containing protein [Lysobacter sp. MMG2]
MSETTDFGPFRLCPDNRVLQRDGADVVLGSRAFDILVALVAARGTVLTHRELMAVAWPGMVVESSNVRVQVANLRKALGCGRDGVRYIGSVAGRGYCFVAQAHAAGVGTSSPGPYAANDAWPSFHADRARPNLPAPLQRALGRDECVAELSQRVLDHRLVTVVGAGGAGKTTLAVLVAHAVDAFDDAVFFVDLSTVMREDMVLEAVAACVGYHPTGPVLLAGLVEVLSTRPTLIVLDNCEHLIDAVARLVTQVLAQSQRVSFLNTSREALRVDGEHVYLLRPLAFPPHTGRLTAGQALAWPAVRLFMDRAREGGAPYALDNRDAATVAAICRRLDGNPLAIGLVASRVGTYGIHGVSDLLANQLALHWQGRRNAVPRHQTVEAMIDWSHDLLPERDRQVLYRLSVFSGAFSMEAAIDVVSDEVIRAHQASEAIGDLIDKSLVSVSAGEGGTWIRLLETTRAYAAERLADTRVRDEVARRHAVHYAGRLQRGAAGNAAEAPQASDLGNVRLAMEWCFAAHHDLTLGAQISSLATPWLLEQSLLDECKRCCARALALLPEPLRSSRVELTLLESLAIACYTMGDYEGEMTSVVERGLAVSASLDDAGATFHLLAGLHLAMMANGRFPDSLDVAVRYAALAATRGGPCETIIAGWMAGSSRHYSGDQIAADANFASSAQLLVQQGMRPLRYFEMKEQVIAVASTARVKWLRGFPLQALDVARRVIEDSRRHPDSLYISVVLCFSILLQNKLDDEAERLIQDLADVANEYKMGTRVQMAHFLTGRVMLHRGHAEEAAWHLGQCLDMLPPPKLTVIRTEALQAMAEALRQQEDGAGALAAIDEAIALAETTGGRFSIAELLRTKAEVLQILPGTKPSRVAMLLARAKDCAREQGALGGGAYERS